MEKIKKRKANLKVISYSVLALGFLFLAFIVDWIFLAGSVILMILNQRELFKK